MCGEYSDRRIHSVWTTKENARKQKELQERKDPYLTYYVEVYALDKPPTDLNFFGTEPILMHVDTKGIEIYLDPKDPSIERVGNVLKKDGQVYAFEGQSYYDVDLALKIAQDVRADWLSQMEGFIPKKRVEEDA